MKLREINKNVEMKSLLGGKSIKYCTRPDNPLGSTMLVTDGNENTGFVVNKEVTNGTGQPDYLSYTFENTVDIDAYKVQIQNYNKFSVNLYFLDKNGKPIFSIPNRVVPGDDGIYALPTRLKDVKRVILNNSDGSSAGTNYKVLEWDLYTGPTMDINLTAEAKRSKIEVKWNVVESAETYILKRALKSGGPYEVIADNITDTAYDDFLIEFDKSYFYIVTASNTDRPEFTISNEAVAVIPEGDFAKLAVLLEVGENAQLSMTHDLLDNLQYDWSSENIKVATVDKNGMIKAEAVGFTYIEARDKFDDYVEYIPVKVVEEGTADNYRLAVHLNVGESERLHFIDDKNVKWRSYDTGIALVNSHGRVGAISKGLALIEAEYEDSKELIYVRVNAE